MTTTTPTTTAANDVETIARELHEQCLYRGYERAVREWCEPLFRAWLDSLANATDTTGAHTRLALAAGMHESLAIRDALIVSVVTDIDDLDTMLDMAARPHEPRNVSIMCQSLAAAFDDPDAKPDTAKSAAATEMLETTVRELDASHAAGAFLSQPEAFSAYIQWWNHQPARARLSAQSALVHDENTTLAAIVLTALDHDINPSWIR
ncbi:MAG: hypothetical protein ACTMHX_04645 [Bifidobacterium mongoliense]|jgi:hypothetical protein